jgi:hypothetical protein
MAKITIPVESGSQAVKDGSIGKIIQSAAERWKPEAMYFAAPEGQRTAFIVFDMADSSDLVPFCEPFYQELDADVEIIPVMPPTTCRGDSTSSAESKYPRRPGVRAPLIPQLSGRVRHGPPVLRRRPPPPAAFLENQEGQVSRPVPPSSSFRIHRPPALSRVIPAGALPYR